MQSSDSVTQWFEQVEHGDSAAAQALWERYFPRLVRLARQRLQGAVCHNADEEDVALSVMNSFYEAAQQHRFPNLADRSDLWRLLLRMTARKVIDLKRYENRLRRGGGKVQNEGDGSTTDGRSLAQVIGDTPSPEFAAVMAEQFHRRISQLTDSDLQAIAIAKLQGFENQDIAAQIGCSVRTVERRLHLIRKKWESEVV